MAKDFLGKILSIFFPNVRFETYINWRDNTIKNGGCSVFINGKRVAFLYAIVDTCGAVVNVFRKGIFASYFMDEMERHIMDYMREEEEKKQEHPRYLYFNHIDTPLR